MRTSNLPESAEACRAAPTRTIRSYAAALALGAIALSYATRHVGSVEWPRDVLAILGLGGVACVMERGRVQIGGRHEESVSLLVILFAAVLFGPVGGAVVGLLSFLSDAREPYLKWAIYSSTRTLTGIAAGAVSVGMLVLTGEGVFGVLAATAVATIIAGTIDRLFAICTGSLRGVVDEPLALLRGLLFLVIRSSPLYFSLVAALVVSYRDVSVWTLPLFFAPVIAAQRLFLMYRDQVRLAEDLLGANTRLQNANLSFATALVASLDARDRYTAGHSAAVAIYSRDIALEMRLSFEDQEMVFKAGLMHDIGKVALPAGILEKSGKLTPSERLAMEQHPEIGAKMLCQIEEFRDIATLVYHHHERIDGRGYPDGTRADKIPLLSRILAVADSYDAMISDRPYREAMSSVSARARLFEGAGTQLDHAVVAAFDKLLSDADEDYRKATRSDFIARRFEPVRLAS